MLEERGDAGNRPGSSEMVATSVPGGPGPWSTRGGVGVEIVRGDRNRLAPATEPTDDGKPTNHLP